LEGLVGGVSGLVRGGATCRGRTKETDGNSSVAIICNRV
jgi:hypothetical protein